MTRDTREIPSLVRFFNAYIGYANIQSRLRRVDEKLAGLSAASPALEQRFAFHRGLTTIYTRLKLSRPIQLSIADQYSVISFLVALQDAHELLSEPARQRLRAMIIGKLSPDEDIREVSHELRCFTHLRRNGCAVRFADLEELGRYDLLVTRGGHQFELECKVIKEDMGHPIPIESSVSYFKAVEEIAPGFTQSGVVRLTLDGKPHLPEEAIREILGRFVPDGSGETRYGDLTIAFEPRPKWSELVTSQRLSELASEITSEHERSNPHAMMVLNQRRAFLFCLTSRKATRLKEGVRRRLREASQQFSKERPALIWLHFLGLSGEEFAALAEQAQGAEYHSFFGWANYVLGSPARSHIIKLRLSGEPDEVRVLGTPALERGPRSYVASGPAYELTSRVSRFPDAIPHASF